MYLLEKYVFSKYWKVKESVSTNVTNTILTNATSTMSIKSDDKEVRYKMYCYILHIHC